MKEAIEYIFTSQEAIAFINKTTRKRFHISSTIELPIPTSPGKCFPGFASARVNKKEAVRVVTDVLTNFEARGARIKISEYESSIFIG